MDLIFILASGAGHIRFTVTCSSDTYVLLEATRASVMGSADPFEMSPSLSVPSTSTPLRAKSQATTPSNRTSSLDQTKAPSSAGYFVARLDQLFTSVGVAHNSGASAKEGEGQTDGVDTFRAEWA